MTSSSRSRLFIGVSLVSACLAGAVWLRPWTTTSKRDASSGRGRLTFNRDVAPILFQHCTPCHRPGQSAPFSLVQFADVKQRAQQIAEVTARRFMPPWLPEPGDFPFANERRLTTNQIEIIQSWVASGAEEGNPTELPPQPTWSEGWQLGQPDLELTMSEAFKLQADGKDLYRNFVIPVALDARRFVRAVELHPGNPRIVHHAVLQIDRSTASRQLDEQDAEPGFGGGMSAGRAQLPDGHFIGWTPGKVPFRGFEGLAWTLDPGTDLVLQLHLRPSGKIEEIQAKIGLHFAKEPPALHSHAVVLRSKTIDIPTGASGHRIEKSFTMPVDTEALAIYPHAHYLAVEMQVGAVFPDGRLRSLLHIKDWDFNWQDEYRFAAPVFLPKGTKISFRYVYDNSAENVRNPHSPPQRVVYGPNSTDEMAELMLQVVPRNANDLSTLRGHSATLALWEDIEVHRKRLEANPNDPAEHRYLGLRLQQLGQTESAISHFQLALRAEPNSGRTHFLLGDALAESGRFDDAIRHFQAADRLEPDQPETLSSLAHALARHPNPSERQSVESIRLATRAVELTERRNPAMWETLAVACASAGQFERAVEASEAAIQAAEAGGQTEVSLQIRKRLDAYKRGTTGQPP